MNGSSWTPTVGIVVNPLAGTDIRRLVASAAPTTDMAKIGVLRRVAIGAIEGGARRLVLTDDRRSLARRAIERIDRDLAADTAGTIEFEILEVPPHDVRENTVDAAAEMRRRGVGAVVVLGGDGTHRDVVRGWRDAPLVALSTGTNNVFPRLVEPTVAGYAAGAVAGRRVCLHDVARRAKVIDLAIERAAGSGTMGTQRDLALVDVALVDGAFTGARAVWHVGSLRQLVATIAEPASVGLAAVAAAALPCGRDEAGGVHLRFAPGASRSVRAPIAPGRYADLAVASAVRIGPGEPIVLAGPGTISFDGERDVVLAAHDRAVATIADDGPFVIDVAAALAAATADARNGDTNSRDD